MKNKFKFLLIIISFFMINAIKPHFGGIVKIRLNEPGSFSLSSTSYSDMVFYSLIYENFFYLKKNGEIFSNIFESSEYENSKKVFILSIKDNLRFSNGAGVSDSDILNSIKSFLGKKSNESRLLGRIIKSMSVKNGKLFLYLNFDYPDIKSLLCSYQLVLFADRQGIFSGPFYPTKWVKGKLMILKPNKYYAGGLAYLDGIQVDFTNYYYPDIFLAKPGTINNGSHIEYNSGVYQNYYIGFPSGKLGKNTRVAFFSILKNFFEDKGYSVLNVLTSENESPLDIKIKQFSKRKIRTILRYSNVKLYSVSTLKSLKNDIEEFFKKYNLKIDTIFVNHNDLQSLTKATKVKYLLMEKVFHRGVSLSNKIKSIVKEMSFGRFNDNYFALIEQLDEIENLNSSELLTDHIAKIIQKIITDGFLLPLAQKKYSIYIRKNIKNVIIDYYGRPLMHRSRYAYKK